ncbi:MAG: metallophosphoesterase [Verrucomicrobia bacterium]|nr:metallophosphoesterase [Verrucomicrobiota bacterium]
MPPYQSPPAFRSCAAALLAIVAADPAPAADLTFFGFSDIHYGAVSGPRDDTPKVRCPELEVINSLPGTPYPAPFKGTVAVPRGVIMQGDLINDGAVSDKYPAQWANYVAEFGVNGEGRCKFPVYEAIGNHDVNENLYVFNKIKERNLTRLKLKHIGNISPNGYHYSWDWDGVHFVNVNLFPGNVWHGEADAYGAGHDPLFARDFLVDDLRRNVGDSGRPVVIVQHFRPIDENWWTFSAADKFQQAVQDYNVILIMCGHQGGGVNNVWRGINWASSNGELDVFRITPDNHLLALGRSRKAWGKSMQKKIYFSYATSGLPAVINNGGWASGISADRATLSGKIVYAAQAPGEVTFYWGTTDGGTVPGAWSNSKSVAGQQVGTAFTTEVAELKPWETYYYRCRTSNAKGEAWSATSVSFTTNGILPAGWQTAFVGHEQRSGGGANHASGTFTVRGSGRDIGERGQPIDNFQYACQDLTGDGEIQIRLATLAVKTREPKVGIMLRESLAADSRNVALLFNPQMGVRWSVRRKTGGDSSATASPTVKNAPCWLRLVRKANTFTGFLSVDGTAWTPLGAAVTIAMPPKILAGLAVTAGNRDESRLHTSTFDNVTVAGHP